MEKLFTHIRFENAGGDFKNDYRFMSTEINEKLKLLTKALHGK